MLKKFRCLFVTDLSKTCSSDRQCGFFYFVKYELVLAVLNDMALKYAGSGVFLIFVNSRKKIVPINELPQTYVFY